MAQETTSRRPAAENADVAAQGSAERANPPPLPGNADTPTPPRLPAGGPAAGADPVAGRGDTIRDPFALAPDEPHADDTGPEPRRGGPPPLTTRAEGPPPPPASSAPKGAARAAPGEATRRTAKRRPAGQPRAQAANDDVSSIGGLIFALHQKPSGRPLQIAAIASGVWALLGVLLGWAMLAPELQRAPTVLEMLARPTAITLAATILIPIALFWLLALLAWRAQELKLMSSAMTEVAIRLAEPDRMAEQQISSVGQSVRRQVNFMNEAVGRALGRAGELETMVQTEVANLERSYNQNEQRIRSLLQELANERAALVNTSASVNLSLKDVGAEIPSLVQRLSEQQVKLARFIEDAAKNVITLENSLNSSSAHLAETLNERTQELGALLSNSTQNIDGLLTGRLQNLQHAITDGTKALQSSVDGTTAQIQNVLTDETKRLSATLETRATELQDVFGAFSDGLSGALDERTGHIEGKLTAISTALESSMQSFAGDMTKTLGSRTEELQAVLEEYTRALDQMLDNRQQSLDLHLVERTRALDDAFSERLKLFDDSILRSTISIDSMVADKARAISAALESHAAEIGDVLAHQADEFDNRLVGGISAVREVTQNVTRQSLKAIEDLAGQADLLKNVSENLVQQISGVSNRFDTQGQNIMRAANALETANFRIDKMLQNRQTELTQTLESLSSKTDNIDRTLRGYSENLEGTFTQAESRARAVSEQLTRGAEERARLAASEFDRLKLAASSDTDRALEDLRGRIGSVAREVGQEIGSLHERFSHSSDEMRDKARRTVAEIEAEQARLRAQIESLPDATRASAATLRASLQDQLKALEQLSSLSSRNALRSEVSAPMPTQLQPQQAPGRSISSITQSLASEMGTRNSPSAMRHPVPGGQRAIAPPQPQPQAPQNAAPPAAPPPAPGEAARDGWKLGDLLARASQTDAAEQSGSEPLNIANMSRALDATTAGAIWARFRAGQRGVMVRSVYTVEGRAAFDEVQRRYKAAADFRQTVDTYMLDFEKILRDADQRDPSGRTAQNYIVSESGRVYLFLAHASGRLV
ncbi:MAG: hypothetical protein R3D68_04435 [Hyphomicrobiaceae bacterium]